MSYTSHNPHIVDFILNKVMYLKQSYATGRFAATFFRWKLEKQVKLIFFLF